MGRNLTAQFASDWASASRHQNRLSLYVLKNLFHIHLNRIPSKQILYRNIFNLCQRYFSLHKLIRSRKYLQFTLCLFTQVQDLSFCLCTCCRNCKKDRTDLILFNCWKDRCSSPYDRYIFNISAPFISVVINNALRRTIDPSGSLQFTYKVLSRITSSDHHNIPAICMVLLFSHLCHPCSLKSNIAISEPNPCNQAKLHDCSYYIIRSRHSLTKHRNSYIKKGCNNACK